MKEQGVLQRRDSRYFGILLRQRRVNGPESIGLAHRRAKRVWWKLKPLDGIGRAVKYCLHRLVCLSQPLSFLNPFWTPPFRRRILPSRRNQKLNVVAFISPSRLHPPPLSSTPLPFLPFLPPPPTYPPRMLDRFNPPFDAVSTIVSVNMLSFSRYNSTFLSRRISIPHTLDRIAWMESWSFKYFSPPLSSICAVASLQLQRFSYFIN